MARVCVIQINVVDLDEAIEFYTQSLGLEIASRDHYPRMVKLATDNVPIILYRVERAVRTEERPDYEDAPRTLINFEVDDLAGTLERLGRAGAAVVQSEPQACPVGIYAGVRDPSGNVIELVEYRDPPS
jgi:predicted enzyme related to lactoylglutathione lyase